MTSTDPRDPDIIAELQRGPARIAAAMSGRSAIELLGPLEPGGWSAREILGHIRACNATWGGYIERILDEDHPSIRGESPRSTIRRMDVLELAFAPSLAAFTADRARLIERLRAAGEAALDRTAAVRYAGRPVADYTAAYYLDRLARHEGEHVRHLEGLAER